MWMDHIVFNQFPVVRVLRNAGPWSISQISLQKGCANSHFYQQYKRDTFSWTLPTLNFISNRTKQNFFANVISEELSRCFILRSFICLWMWTFFFAFLSCCISSLMDVLFIFSLGLFGFLLLIFYCSIHLLLIFESSFYSKAIDLCHRLQIFSQHVVCFLILVLDLRSCNSPAGLMSWT